MMAMHSDAPGLGRDRFQRAHGRKAQRQWLAGRAGSARAWCGLVLLLVATLAPTHAWANAGCHFTQGTGPGTVTFAVTGTLAFQADLPVGSVLWTSAPTNPTPVPHLNCSDAENGNGISTATGTQIATVPGFTDVFPTNPNGLATDIKGIGYRIIRGDTGKPIQAYPNDIDKENDYQFDFPIQLQLVKTSETVTGGNLNILGYWAFKDGNGGDGRVVETFQFNSGTGGGGGIVLQPISCSVNTDSKNFEVQLPSVPTGDLITAPTAGTTPFNINLSCAAGTTVKITLASDEADPDASHVGVMLPTASDSARGVALRLLDGNNQPVPFGTKQTVGAAPSGPLAIPYRIQYIRTGRPVLAGQVAATATFTMAYE